VSLVSAHHRLFACVSPLGYRQHHVGVDLLLWRCGYRGLSQPSGECSVAIRDIQPEEEITDDYGELHMLSLAQHISQLGGDQVLRGRS
jgi:hypothetical protein